MAKPQLNKEKKPKPTYDPNHLVKLSTLANFQRLPTGIATIDVFSGGGIPIGTNSLFSGPAGSGKTIIVTCALANFLTLNPSLRALYINADNKLSVGNVVIKGGDTNRVEVLFPGVAEEAQKVVEETAIKRKDVGLVIVDSLAALSPEKETIGGEEMSVAARLNNKFFRKMTAIQLVRLAAGNPLTLLIINQIRTTIGLFPSIVLPGGNQQRFQAALWISLTKQDLHIDTASNLPIAITMRYSFTKNEGGASGWPGETRMATTPHGKWMPLDFIDHEFIWVWAAQRLGLLQNRGVKGWEYKGEFKPKKATAENNKKEGWIDFWEDHPESYQQIKQETITAFLEWNTGKRKASFIQEQEAVTIEGGIDDERELAAS